MKKSILLIITILVVYVTGCNQAGANASAAFSNPQSAAPTQESKPAFTPDNAFNAYWFAGKAELCSYDYTINRYDEQRNGNCVFIFVTEDLSKNKQVKLDNAPQAGSDRVPVLKLNALQKFQTGIYDYSLMNSLFTPIDINNYPRSLKTTTTVQDWCGHVFTQMNLIGNKYHVKSFSYFEMEGDKESDTEGGAMLEDEIFTRLRINPESLPNKNIKIVPNLTYTRLRHKPIEAESASIEIKDEAAGVKSCIVNYSNIKRRLVVSFEGASPYKILGFTEFDGEKIMSEAKLKKSMMSDYWAKHDIKSDPLRKELGL